MADRGCGEIQGTKLLKKNAPMTGRLPCPALFWAPKWAALPCPALGGAALAAALPCPVPPPAASPMVMTETVLMLISIGASEGIDGEQFDFAMAFTQAPCEEPDQFIELPDMPDSLLAEHPHLGPSRGPTYVGRLRKELYGRHYAARGQGWRADPSAMARSCL